MRAPFSDPSRTPRAVPRCTPRQRAGSPCSASDRLGRGSIWKPSPASLPACRRHRPSVSPPLSSTAPAFSATAFLSTATSVIETFLLRDPVADSSIGAERQRAEPTQPSHHVPDERSAASTTPKTVVSTQGRAGEPSRWRDWGRARGDDPRSPSPHFSPGAVMIAEEFGPVRTRSLERALATESIAGTTVEGARARTGPKDPRGSPARSAGGRGQRSPQSARSSTSRPTS